jgi:CHRD domain
MNMKPYRRHALSAGAILAGLLVQPSTAPAVSAHGHHRRAFSARLSSFNEGPLTLSTPARGSFRAKLSKDGTSLSYKLTISGLTDVRQSHIHLGKTRLNGGIMVWLCQSPTNVDPTGTAPMCVDEGTVEGTLSSANVLGLAGQGLPAGAFDEFIEALHKDAGYVNVHTGAFPGGEIRGQVEEED